MYGNHTYDADDISKNVPILCSKMILCGVEFECGIKMHVMLVE